MAVCSPDNLKTLDACFPYSLPGAPGYGQCHVLASFCDDSVAWHARPMERASPFRALLAHRHASPLPRAENLGGVGPLDAGLAHGLALSPRAQGDLLEWPSAGGKVGAGSLHHLATSQGRNAVSRGGRQCETQAGAPESPDSKRAEKRASAVVCWHPLAPIDCHVGRVSPPCGLSCDSAQNRSGVPDGRVPLHCG